MYIHTKSGKQLIKIRPVISYQGSIYGDSSSKVSLHYSEGDLAGFIEGSNGRRYIVGRDFSVKRSESNTLHSVTDEVAFEDVSPFKRGRCGNEALPDDLDVVGRQMSIPGVVKSVEGGQAEYLRVFKLALVIKEDATAVMRQRGLSSEESIQYLIKIYASIAQMWEQEINAYLLISYLEQFTEEEPTGYYYSGSDVPALANEFSLDWSSRMNGVDRTVAHLVTAYRPSGLGVVGIGYLGQMCNKKNGGGYSVSAMFFSDNPLPGNPNLKNAFTSDVNLTAHELGHNIGAYHTHNCYWSPPVDTCRLKSDGTDGCYNVVSLRRVVDGTVMSYCEDVNGGRVPLTYGSRVAERMRGWITSAACNLPVAKPTVTITEPRGSDAYALGERVTFRWASALVSAVNILWSPSVMGPWTTIASNLNAADRLYVWTAAILPVETFWFRIEDASNPDVNDTSLASFQISVPVKLDLPKGGERMGVGSKFTVRWTKKAGVGNVKLEFAPDGASYTTLLESSPLTSFEWTVPNTIAENARMRVLPVGIPTASSSSGAIAIGNPRFALEIPNEGTFLCKNQVNQYRWSADFIASIRIQYSTNGGAIWRPATQQATIETSLGQVFSRNITMNNVPAGTMLKLRVLDAESEALLDAIDSLRMDSCAAAVSVNDAQGDAPYSISEVAPNPASSLVRLSVASTVPLTCDAVLLSLDGRETVLRVGIFIAPGRSTLDILVDSVASGLYRIGLREGGSLITMPLVVVR